MVIGLKSSFILSLVLEERLILERLGLLAIIVVDEIIVGNKVASVPVFRLLEDPAPILRPFNVAMRELNLSLGSTRRNGTKLKPKGVELDRKIVMAHRVIMVVRSPV